MKIVIAVFVTILSYLLGSLSPSIIISNAVAKKDIRSFGSGNAGSTNMVRTFGWKIGLLTFALDVLKGTAVALLCRFVSAQVGDPDGIIIMLGCVAAIVGHGFPIYYKFHGGKGVASTLGIFLVIMPLPTLGALAISLVLIFITGMVSVGSIIGMLICSVFSLLFSNSTCIVITIIALAIFTIFLHRENIVRILHKTERKLSFGKK